MVLAKENLVVLLCVTNLLQLLWRGGGEVHVGQYAGRFTTDLASFLGTLPTLLGLGTRLLY